jgi:hypothetical protein
MFLQNFIRFFGFKKELVKKKIVKAAFGIFLFGKFSKKGVQ